MPNARRRFTAQHKAEAVRRHLTGKQPISDLADELQLQPSQVYLWTKQVLDQAERALQPTATRARDDGQTQRIQELEAALARKADVVTELIQQLAHCLVAQPPLPK